MIMTITPKQIEDRIENLETQVKILTQTSQLLSTSFEAIMKKMDRALTEIREEEQEKKEEEEKKKNE
jgi:hypothetical protein